MKQPDEKLFTALARAAERRVCEFNAQHIANTTWAFATIKQPHEKLLFTASARAAEHCIGNFDVQHVRMTLWAVSQNDNVLKNSEMNGFRQTDGKTD